MATLDIEFRARRVGSIDKQLTSFGTSLGKIEETIKNIDFSKFIKNINDIGVSFRTATKDVNDFGKALNNSLKSGGNSTIDALKASTQSYRTELARLKAENQQLRNDLQANNKAIADSKLAYEQGRSSQQSYRTEVSRLKVEIEKLRLAKAQNRQQTIAASGSYREAQQRLTALGNTIRNTEGGLTRLTPALRAQITEYRRLNEQLKAFDRAMGNHQRNVGNYSSAFLGSLPVIGQFTTAIGLAAAAQQGLSKSFRTNLEFDAIDYSMKQIVGTGTSFEYTMNRLRKESERLGLDFKSMVSSFRQWQAAAKYTNLTGEQSYRIFESVANAGAKLNLSNEQVQGTFLALSQMMSKGVVSMEELRRQLGDRLYGAFQLAAQAMGLTEKELNKLVSSGKLMSEEFLPKFAEQLDKSFGNDKTEKIESMQAAVNRLSNEWDSFWRSDAMTTFFTKASDGFAMMLKDIKDILNAPNLSEAFRQSLDRNYRPIPTTSEGWGKRQAIDATQGKDLEGVKKELIRYVELRQKIKKDIQESGGSATSEQKRNLSILSHTVVEIGKIRDLLMNPGTDKNNLLNGLNDDSEKSKKSLKDISEILVDLRASDGSYFDEKIAKINIEYDKLVKRIKESKGSGADIAEALNLAGAKKDFDLLKTDVEKFLYDTKNFKPFTGKQSVSLSGALSIPTKLPGLESAIERFGKINPMKFADEEMSRYMKMTFRRNITSSLNGMSKDIVSSFQAVYDIEDKYAKLREDSSADQIQALNKMMRLEKQINNGLSNLFVSLANGLGNIGGGLLSGAVSDGIAAGKDPKTGESFSQLKNLFKGDNKMMGYGALGSLLGGALMNLSPKTSMLAQGLGGALSGAGAGAMAGVALGATAGSVVPIIGTAIGAILGALGGIFGAGKSRKQRELQEAQLAEQRKQTALMERQQALAFTSSIIGQRTNQGIVTGVDRNAFGDITFEIEGRKLKAVMDKENAAQGRGIF